MVAIAHLEKFIRDAKLENGEEILAKAKALGEDPIASGKIEEILGEERAAQLFRLIETDPGYIKTSMWESFVSAVKNAAN